MRIQANSQVCIGSGQCVFTDPELFDQDDIGTVLLLDDSPGDPAAQARAKQAVSVCPSRALSIVAD